MGYRMIARFAVTDACPRGRSASFRLRRACHGAGGRRSILGQDERRSDAGAAGEPLLDIGIRPAWNRPRDRGGGDAVRSVCDRCSPASKLRLRPARPRTPVAATFRRPFFPVSLDGDASSPRRANENKDRLHEQARLHRLAASGIHRCPGVSSSASRGQNPADPLDREIVQRLSTPPARRP